MAPPATVTVFNILRDTTGAAVSAQSVQCVLNYNAATVSATGDALVVIQQSTTTDSSGRYSFVLVPNDLIAPANTTYTIIEPGRRYDIAPQSTGGPSQQTTAVGVIVNTPATLAAATSSVSGALTVSGLLTAQAGEVVTGGLTTDTLALSSGGISMAGPLTLTAVASQIIPGATSLSLRNNANGADNLLVSNAGLVTVRAGLTVTAGTLTMGAAASQLVPGATSFSVRDTANANDNLLISNAGAATIRAGLTVTAGGATVSAGGLTVTGTPDLSLGTAVSRIKPGATSLSLRNNANTADNVLVADAGGVTLRNAVSMPPIAGGTVAPTSYGTVTVKIDEKSPAGTSVSFTSIPAGFRHLEVVWRGRTDNAAEQVAGMQFNGDTAANYNVEGFIYTNNTSGSGGLVGQTSGRVGSVPGTAIDANSVNGGTIRVIDYATTTTYKIYHAQAIRRTGAAAPAAGDMTVENDYGGWRSTAAITRLDVVLPAGNFTSALFTLYGIP